jgi:hypothetical protein
MAWHSCIVIRFSAEFVDFLQIIDIDKEKKLKEVHISERVERQSISFLT